MEQKEPPPTDSDHHECTICLQSYVSDEGLLKCKHSFCYTCIEDWSKQENTCPLCKIRFSYIERVSKDNHDTNAAVGGKRKSKPKNKRTNIKKKSQSDAKPVYGGRGVLNAQDAYMHHMLQSYIARQMQQHRHEVEDDDEDESDDDMGNYFMMNRHGMNLSNRHPGLFGRSATVDLTGNSSNNPINLMDEDTAPPAVRTSTSSSSSSSNHNGSRSATIIDLAGDDDDTTANTTTNTSSSSNSSSSAAPVDLTGAALNDMSSADRARVLELMEDELDALDDDYEIGLSDDDDDEEDEDEEDMGAFVERVLGRSGTAASASSSSAGRHGLSSGAARVSLSGSNRSSNARSSLSTNSSAVRIPVRTAIRATAIPLSRSVSAPPVRARRPMVVRSVTPSPQPPHLPANSSSSSSGSNTNSNSNSNNDSTGRVTRTRSLQK